MGLPQESYISCVYLPHFLTDHAAGLRSILFYVCVARLSVLGFIKLMEQYYGKRFRILIIIEDLDKCGNDKICDLFSVSSLPRMHSAWYLKQ